MSSGPTWPELLGGVGVIVGLRLLDYVFPRGYIWKKVLDWSVRAPSDEEKKP